MSEKHSTNGQPTRAALYLRKSTDRQEDSIERQRAGVLPYCQQRGYQLAREAYIDHGLVGVAPYGLRVARTIDQDTGKVIERKCVHGPEEEIRVVRFIFEAVADRGWSLRRVCRELEERSVKPPVGNGRGKNKAGGFWNP